MVEAKSFPDNKDNGEGAISPQISKIADAMFLLESSRGKNVNCPANQFNGYGFRQNTFEWKCYNTQEEVRELVEDWIADKIQKGYTIKELSCYYNKGVKTETCDYADKLVSVLQ